MGFNPMDPGKRVQVMLQSGASSLRRMTSPTIADQVAILKEAAAGSASAEKPDDTEPPTDRTLDLASDPNPGFATDPAVGWN